MSFMHFVKENNFFKSMSIYTMSNVLNALIPFLLLPILSRYLSPEQYGIYAIYILLVNGLVPITSITISRSIVRNYVDQETIDISIYTYSCLLLSTISTLIVFIVVTIFSNSISKGLLFPQSWLWAPVIASYGQTYLAVSLGLLQMTNKPLLYGFLRISHSLLLTVITLYLVLSLNWKEEGPILGHTLSMLAIIPFAIIIFAYKGYLTFKISYVYIIDALKYGLPLIPHIIGLVIITMIDRVFINNYVGIDAVGIFSAGYQISLILFIFITSFNQAWTPWLFPKLKDGSYRNKKIIVKAVYLFFLVLIISAFLFALALTPFVEFYLDKSYIESKIVIPWLLVSFVFHGMHITMCSFLYFTKRTGILSLVTIMAALVNILLNFIFVPLNGIIGAAQASIISFFFAFVYTWYYVDNSIKLPWFTYNKKIFND